MATTQNNQDNCELPTMRRDVPVPESDGLALSLSQLPPHPPPPPPPVVVVATATVHYLSGTLSPHTQAKTNLRSGATVDAKVHKPPGETGDNRPRPNSPAPRSPNDETYQSEEGSYEEEDRLCFLVWAISAVTVITVIIPLGLFMLSMPSTAVRTSQDSQPSTTPSSTTAVPEAQFCATQLRQDTSRVLFPSAADSYSFGTGDEGVQYREVICVLDIKYHIKTPPYHPRYLPLSYCTMLTFSSLAVVDNATVEPKRSELHTVYLRLLHRMQTIHRTLKHRSKEVPVYFTLGGDLADSANISKALSDSASRSRLARVVEKMTSRYIKGVHLDWDHPGSRCGDPHDAANLRSFVFDLSKNLELMLSVPPSPALVSLYNLSGIIDRLKLVIVKTHTIRQDNSLACTGDRIDAHAAFLAIRASVPESHRDKLAYTMQLGVNKFEPNSAAPAVTDLASGHPGRTTYRRVCALYPDVEAPVDVECRLGSFVEHGKEYPVAFAGPRELKARMRSTYADGMGSVPVVVHGLDLDDFLGRCPSGVMSPLVRAVATGGP